MRFLYNKQNPDVKLSIIILDWNCRESFHLFNYLEKQNVDRSAYEVIWIEYYDRIPKDLDAIQQRSLGLGRQAIDKWVIIEMPEDIYYHKHLMYNIGLFYAQGDYVCIMDSDVMVKDDFIQSIVSFFDEHPKYVLHLDQFRNHNRQYYPFHEISFEEFLQNGCINDAGGVTKGLASEYDAVHRRNYGACFTAPRQALLDIKGSDEHLYFLGHICGPYDLTFRLMNKGYKVHWHKEQFLYHTWHPGSDGVDNYMGPQDGKNNALTSLMALDNGQVMPFLPNKAIEMLSEGKDKQEAEKYLFDDIRTAKWKIENLKKQ